MLWNHHSFCGFHGSAKPQTQMSEKTYVGDAHLNKILTKMQCFRKPLSFHTHSLLYLYIGLVDNWICGSAEQQWSISLQQQFNHGCKF